MTVPTSLTVGNTWAWTHTVDGYPASNWPAAVYYFAHQGDTFEVAATVLDDNYVVAQTPTQTRDRAPGDYAWYLLVTNGTDRFSAAQGLVTLLPDPAAWTEHDPRTHNQKMLAAIEAMLEQRATAQQLDVVSYSVGNRSLSRSNLIELRDYYAKLVAQEQNAAAIAAGGGNPNRIYIRPVRV